MTSSSNPTPNLTQGLTADAITRSGVLRIFIARQILTMDESLPTATAVGVIDDRIVAVGDLASMAPWREGRDVVVDERLKDMVLMPGFIDNHVHPFLGALLTPMEIIAPEAWRMEGGRMAPAANTPERYLELLTARLAARADKTDWFISFGYQPSEHGRWTRAELDLLCPDRPVILWQRSFHETYLNSAAIDKLGLTPELIGNHPQVNLAEGHFFETGNKLVMGRLMPYLLRPEWYHRGLNVTAELMQQGGITTAGDMLFGAMGAEYEFAALDACIEKPQRPLRIINIADARSASNQAIGKQVMGVPTDCPPFAKGLVAIEALRTHESRRVKFSKAVKLFADGAMFSQLMMMNPPGYIDGHHGEWLMSPEVLAKGVDVFWDAGYQIHVHVNGDAGMDSVLTALAAAQERKPRFDPRFMMHHVGFHTNAQSRRMAALGAHASVNSYYIHALADGYGRLGLGQERADQIVRAGSMVRNGMRVSLHSDFMMAPMEPLLLAWCAATRITKSGRTVSPQECLSLDQALRGITIDAAFALNLDHEIGSIVAGKKADFTVLLDDPQALGAQGLKDVRVAGTVFEGELHMLSTPMASSLSVPLTDRSAHVTPLSRTHSLPLTGIDLTGPMLAQDDLVANALTAPANRYRLIAGGCCTTDGDPCVFLRQLGGWWGGSLNGPQSKTFI
jgi:predicted amidohydrolase YtcJ